LSCFYPITGYRSKSGRNPVTGLWPIVFNVKDGYVDKEVILPCGRCIGCRLEKSRQWAIRCLNEAQLHENNAFITLTYDEDHLPENNSLQLIDVQKFYKKLRKKYKKFKYYQCGEYGERFQRPHYHACIFGIDIADKVLWSVRSGVKLYRSESLEKIWGLGFVTVGEVTFESAAYVARYVLKKITGEKAVEHYKGRTPEFQTMSRNPGIGKEWLLKYRGDVESIDAVMQRGGFKLRPPRYYDTILGGFDLEALEKRKRERRKKIKAEEQSWDRLEVKEKVLKARLKQLKRRVENGSQDIRSS